MQWVTPNMLTELAMLAMAFVLSAVIGLERGRKLKSAGLRTHTLVGLGAAVFTLVSAYGFAGMGTSTAITDPTRIAAQIVSGVGFLGAGVIFVRGGTVSGLTTAASIWVTASIGMACGAGMPLLAIMVTILHLVTVTVLTRVARQASSADDGAVIRLRYRDGYGVLRRAIALAAEAGLETVVTSMTDASKGQKIRHDVTVRIPQLHRIPVDVLIDSWAALPGVVRVETVEDGD